MSFYSDASLVMIPSGYKTSKVYSAVPTDGAGDLSFSRSNDTATRVNSAGLIEKVRTNLYPRGSALLATGWTSAGATLTAGQTDPNGGTGALRVQLAAGAANYIQYAESGLSANTPLTRSLYIKAASAQSIKIADPTGTGDKTINLTTSYQRFDLVAPANGSGVYGLYLENSDTLAKDFTIAFVQIETGDIATDYIPTTSAAVSVGPVANVPRLDYLNSSCPRLLLEGQRTNLALFSESFDNAAWTKGAATITANAVTSPDGYTNADSFLPTATTSAHSVDPATLINLGGVVGTFSVFAKYNGYHLSLSIAGSSTNWTGCVFDLQNGIARTPQKGGSQVVCTSKIEDYGNGWYRCSISYTPYAGGAFYTYIGATSTNNATLGNFGLQSFAANGTSGAYLYGAQVETSAAYATSYIPTLGAAVTRGADVASKTGISSLIGQTEGTLFAEFVHNGADILTTQTVISINSGNTQNFVNIGVYDGQLNPAARASSVDIFDLYVGPNPLPAGTHKIALAYKSGDFKIYLNGSAVYTDTAAATFGTMGQLDLGTLLSVGVQLGEGIKQALVFKTRLTNDSLAELTSL